MAGRGVCYCSSVRVGLLVIVAFILPFSDSSLSSGDGHVEYAVHGFTSTLLDTPAVRSLEDAERLRVKRQAQTPSSFSPSPSSSIVSTGLPTIAQTTTPQVPPTVRAATWPTTTPRPTPQPTQRPQPPQQPNPGPRTTPMISNTIRDNHHYYTSAIFPDEVDKYFVNLYNPRIHPSLSTGHRLAATIDLPFKFRFYGHTISNVTVATGGFMYVSPFIHKWLTATQYIAPLMANFHTSSSAESTIFYQQIGDEFVVEWHKVYLKDQEQKGPFIFQSKLKADGTITFVYKNLPVPVTNISSTDHPVKIGLSDAFYNDTFLPEFGLKRRTIIEYHRVAFSAEQIELGTVIVLKPLPTCNTITDCGTCVKHTSVKFNCQWCSRVSRCSDGLDWFRQDWERKGCKKSATADLAHCIATTPTSTLPSTSTSTVPSTNTPTVTGCRNSDDCEKDNETTVAVVVSVVVILVVMLCALGVWMYYAYTHPTSPSGIWFMEHRPSQLRSKLPNMKFWKKDSSSSSSGTASKYALESKA